MKTGSPVRSSEINQMSTNGSLRSGESSGDGKKWLDSGCTCFECSANRISEDSIWDMRKGVKSRPYVKLLT